MYLSKLNVLGFKSFAQKTKLEFNNGISCIIGPNGSGKSNIVDAIRWVLGEQRSSSLRSDKMENVIFNGTRQRKPMGMAEVAMTIQNNKKILNTEFDEVVIARRLYRSGESQYLINNVPVRLKDVLDIFMDTGMGANSYSVIELKMVESILSENKSERRQLFEEAAGVVKYKIRRKSALRKLDATRTDLTRLNDIISEVQKTVNSLSRQVGKARRYLAYTDELRKLDIELSRFRYHRLLDELRPLKVQLSEASKLKEETHHQITMDEALLEDYKREQVKIEQVLQAINKELHDYDAQIAQMNQDEAVGRTRSEGMAKTRERYQVEIEDFKKKTTLLQENLHQYRQELDELLDQKEVFDEKFTRIEQERKVELEKLQKDKTEIDRLNNEFRQKFQQLAQQKEQLKQKEYQQNFQTEQLSELDERLASFQTSLNNLDEEKQKLDKEGRGQKELLQNASAKLELLLKEEAQIKEKRNGLEQQKNQVLSELERSRSRKHFFEQIIANYEGHSKSTQFAMAQQDHLAGVHGPLSDIISIDEKYARIVEIILGDALNYVLVEDIQTAKKLIGLVKEKDKGRITLVPLSQINKIEPTELPAMNNEIQMLSGLIDCDASYKTLVNILLGDVAIVDSLDEALQLSTKYPQLRFCTPDGEMVNFNREVSGGSSEKKSASIVGRKDQLKKYALQVQSLQKDIDQFEDQLTALRGKFDETIAAQDKEKQNIAVLQKRLIEIEKNENQVRYEINKSDSDHRNSEARLTTLRKNMKELKQQIEVMQVEVESRQLELNELEKETISRTNEYEEQSEAMQALLEDVQRARLNATNLQNQVSNRQSDINRTDRSIKELANDILNRKNEIEQIERSLVQIQEDSEKRREQQTTIWDTRDKKQSEQEMVVLGFQELKSKVIDLEEQTKKFRRQHDTSMERARSLELQINENQYKAETVREYALKEYSEDVEVGIPFEDLNEEENEEKIELLKSRIKNLGPVNPLAVGEYDKEKERLEFLSKQRDDLLTAEKSLLETIDKINKTARKQFLETFNAIRENFEKVFHSFFENGEGTIKLDDSADPLEADIEIQVRTKGKRLQTLTLLSGGEKTLTAISLLFSIYLVKPSPFCILDEVDAPLDDVNIGRFTDALGSFSDNTQFIVVTHNKRTMEAAETMYGVTMEEEGVSKLVSVKFT